MTDLLQQYLPFIIPLFLVQLALAIAALIHVLRHKNYRFGNRPMWIVIVLLVNMIGPIVYFIFGRGEDA